MTRQRWFCSFCGGLTDRPPDARDGRVRCRGHAALPIEVDLIPPDPLESLPTMAADYREDSEARKGEAV